MEPSEVSHSAMKITIVRVLDSGAADFDMGALKRRWSWP
jgi:hypothetical protein